MRHIVATTERGERGYAAQIGSPLGQRHAARAGRRIRGEQRDRALRLDRGAEELNVRAVAHPLR